MTFNTIDKENRHIQGFFLRFGNGWKFGGDKSGESGGWAAN
jgi:hypothetical protein